MITKTFQYRLYPNIQQEELFRQFAGCARFIYNWGLARWLELEQQGLPRSIFTLNNELPALKQKEGFEWLQDCSSQVLQQSLENLGKAFSRLFKKQAKLVGFKKRNRGDSFRFPQRFEVLEETQQLKLPKIGLVRYVQDRAIEGTPKQITVKLRAGNWYALVVCDVDKELPTHDSSRGICGVDVGVAKLLTVCDGESTRVYQHNPRLPDEYRRLAKYQRAYSRKQRRSNNQAKALTRVQRIHQRIANMRKDTLHKVSTELARSYSGIAVEDLKLLSMVRSAKGTLVTPGRNVVQKRGLNRSISRQGWGLFFRYLAYKTQWYGSRLLYVDARYTSQTCPQCGCIDSQSRKSQATFQCVACGYHDNADYVAATNIRSRGVYGYAA